MERRHAYRLMESAPIARDLCPTGHIPERAIREIAKVAPEKRHEVFEKATEAASGGVRGVCWRNGWESTPACSSL